MLLDSITYREKITEGPASADVCGESLRGGHRQIA